MDNQMVDASNFNGYNIPSPQTCLHKNSLVVLKSYPPVIKDCCLEKSSNEMVGFPAMRLMAEGVIALVSKSPT